MAAQLSPRPRRGDALLATLLCLLVCLLAVLYAMRGTTIDTLLTGNNLAKQKSAQSGDIALRALESQILAMYGGRPLELSAQAQPWWRAVAPGAAPPDAAYWASCLGNANPALRCSKFTLALGGSPLPYTALAVVQPTGRIDGTSCTLSQYQAIYYDIYLNVTESSGASGAVTETIYKLCAIA